MIKNPLLKKLNNKTFQFFKNCINRCFLNLNKYKAFLSLIKLKHKLNDF